MNIKIVAACSYEDLNRNTKSGYRVMLCNSDKETLSEALSNFLTSDNLDSRYYCNDTFEGECIEIEIESAKIIGSEENDCILYGRY